MRINLLLIVVVFSISSLYAQVGIRTTSPQGWLHINAGMMGSGADDVIIKDVVGIGAALGIGTLAPANKLTIETTGANTGLHLPFGAGVDKVFTSDNAGNGVWADVQRQYQTWVSSSPQAIVVGDSPLAPNVQFPSFVKVGHLGIVKEDGIQAAFGAAYGWQTNKTFVVPADGIYRIAFGVYFQGHTGTYGSVRNGDNLRAYVFRNNAQFIEPGIVSVTFEGNDVSGFVMGLCKLSKNDVIDLRVSNRTPYNDVALRYHGGDGHTYLVVEYLTAL